MANESGRASEPTEPDPPSGAGPGAGAEEPVPAPMTQVRLRRAPRYRPFVFTGVLVGLVLAGAVATALPLAEGFSLRVVFAYFALPLGIVGGLIGAAAAIVLERRR